MGFKQDQRFAKIWEIEDKGNYHVVSLSTSKKNKETDKYETDFSCKFVRLVGTAHKDAFNLKVGDSIKIGSCEVTNKYDKEKATTYTNYVIYSFEKEENNSSNNNNSNSDGFMDIPEGIDEELPFN
jgi:ribosomal protein S17